MFPQGTLIWPFQILVMPAIVFFLAEAHLAGFRKILCAAAALTPYQVLFAPFLLLHSIVLGCPLPREEKSSSNIANTSNRLSRVAQWKRAGPITQRSMDRNHSLLRIFFHPPSINKTVCYLPRGRWIETILCYEFFFLFLPSINKTVCYLDKFDIRINFTFGNRKITF